MNDYSTVNILDMIDAIGEDEVKYILSDFSCPKNVEIEDFVKNKAVDFAKRKISCAVAETTGRAGLVMFENICFDKLFFTKQFVRAAV